MFRRDEALRDADSCLQPKAVEGWVADVAVALLGTNLSTLFKTVANSV